MQNFQFGDARDQMIGLAPVHGSRSWNPLSSTVHESGPLQAPIRAYETLLEMTAHFGLAVPHQSVEPRVMAMLSTPEREAAYHRAYGGPVPERFRDLPREVQSQAFALFLSERVSETAQHAAGIRRSTPIETSGAQTDAWLAAIRNATAEYFGGPDTVGTAVIRGTPTHRHLGSWPHMQWEPEFVDQLIRLENRNRVAALGTSQRQTANRDLGLPAMPDAPLTLIAEAMATHDTERTRDDATEPKRKRVANELTL